MRAAAASSTSRWSASPSRRTRCPTRWPRSRASTSPTRACAAWRLRRAGQRGAPVGQRPRAHRRPARSGAGRLRRERPALRHPGGHPPARPGRRARDRAPRGLLARGPRLGARHARGVRPGRGAAAAERSACCGRWAFPRGRGVGSAPRGARGGRAGGRRWRGPGRARGRGPSAGLLETLGELPPGRAAARLAAASGARGVVARPRRGRPGARRAVSPPRSCAAPSWPRWPPEGGRRAARRRRAHGRSPARAARGHGGVLALSSAVVLLLLALAGLLERLETTRGWWASATSSRRTSPAEDARRVADLPACAAAAPLRRGGGRLLPARGAAARRGLPRRSRALRGAAARRGPAPAGPARPSWGSGWPSASACAGATLATQPPRGPRCASAWLGWCARSRTRGRWPTRARARCSRPRRASSPTSPWCSSRGRPAEVERGLRALGATPTPAGGAVAHAGFLGVLASLLRVVALANGVVCLYALVQALALTAVERRGSSPCCGRAAPGGGRWRSCCWGRWARGGPGGAARRAPRGGVLGPLVGRLAIDYAALSLAPSPARCAGRGPARLAAAARRGGPPDRARAHRGRAAGGVMRAPARDLAAAPPSGATRSALLLAGGGGGPRGRAHAPRVERRTWADPDGDGALLRGPRRAAAARTELAPEARPGASSRARADHRRPRGGRGVAGRGEGGRSPRGALQAAFRPQEALAPHVLAAAVRAVNAARPEAVVVTGDLVDSAQATSWSSPSGCWRVARCGPTRAAGLRRPAGGPDPDPLFYRPDVDAPRFPGCSRRAAPFRSPGLRAPWYPAVGNHDALVEGLAPPTSSVRAAATGDRALRRWTRTSPVGPGATVDADVDALLQDGRPGARGRCPPIPSAAPSPPRSSPDRLRTASRGAGHRARGSTTPSTSARASGPSCSTPRREGGSDGVVGAGQLACWRPSSPRASGRALARLLPPRPRETAAATRARPPRRLPARGRRRLRSRAPPRDPPAGHGRRFWLVGSASLVEHPQQARSSGSARRPAAARAGDVDARPRRPGDSWPGSRASSPTSTSRVVARTAAPARPDRNVRLFVRR